MKLYLRRQTLTTTKGMLSKRTEISFSLYARLEVSPTEMEAIKEFLPGAEMVGSHLIPVPGNREDAMTSSYNAAQLLEGKDIPCPSFTNMMGLEQSLLKGTQAFAEVVAHAQEVKQNHEAVHDLSLAA